MKNANSATEQLEQMLKSNSSYQLTKALESSPSSQLIKALESNPSYQLKKALEATQGSVVTLSRPLAQQLLESLSSLNKTPFELAMEKLKRDAKTMPLGFEFEIPQVVGTDIWGQLDRGSKLALGKHVKASQNVYGLEFLRTSTSNHAIYRRAE